MESMFDISGKVAVITGAGGVLGGSIAASLMKAGAKVVATDIRQENLDARVAELKQIHEDVIGVVGNVLDLNNLKELAQTIRQQWGTIDILVNCAGGNIPGATLREDQNVFDMKIEDWEKVTDLNMN